jgi:hypothetical protein
MFKFSTFVFVLMMCGLSVAQQPPAASQEQAPPVKVTYLNVCTPSDDEKSEIAATLAKIPKQAKFVPDFQIARGLSTMENAQPSRYVRLRRELPVESKLSTVQYSISNNGKDIVETLVFSGRDPKDLSQLSLEDSVTASASRPATLLAVDTPASRIKVERFGKTSVGLARCEGVDQGKYDPLFATASALFADYRKSLAIRSMLSSELRWLAGGPAGAAMPARTKATTKGNPPK